MFNIALVTYVSVGFAYMLLGMFFYLTDDHRKAFSYHVLDWMMRLVLWPIWVVYFAVKLVERVRNIPPRG